MTAKNKNLTFLFVLIMIAAFALTACTSSLTLQNGSTFSGNSVSNIIGNGHTVYYDAKACSALGGLSYSLSGGGSLMPAP
jgi:hypothetical protein